MITILKEIRGQTFTNLRYFKGIEMIMWLTYQKYYKISKSLDFNSVLICSFVSFWMLIVKDWLIFLLRIFRVNFFLSTASLNFCVLALFCGIYYDVTHFIMDRTPSYNKPLAKAMPWDAKRDKSIYILFIIKSSLQNSEFLSIFLYNFSFYLRCIFLNQRINDFLLTN